MGLLVGALREPPLRKRAGLLVGALREAPLRKRAGLLVGAVREPRLQIVRVGRPAQRVRPNVFPDFIQFIFIADDVIVEISLP